MARAAIRGRGDRVPRGPERRGQRDSRAHSLPGRRSGLAPRCRQFRPPPCQPVSRFRGARPGCPALPAGSRAARPMLFMFAMDPAILRIDLSYRLARLVMAPVAHLTRRIERHPGRLRGAGRCWCSPTTRRPLTPVMAATLPRRMRQAYSACSICDARPVPARGRRDPDLPRETPSPRCTERRSVRVSRSVRARRGGGDTPEARAAPAHGGKSICTARRLGYNWCTAGSHAAADWHHVQRVTKVRSDVTIV